MRVYFQVQSNQITKGLCSLTKGLTPPTCSSSPSSQSLLGTAPPGLGVPLLPLDLLQELEIRICTENLVCSDLVLPLALLQSQGIHSQELHLCHRDWSHRPVPLDYFLPMVGGNYNLGMEVEEMVGSSRHGATSTCIMTSHSSSQIQVMANFISWIKLPGRWPS